MAYLEDLRQRHARLVKERQAAQRRVDLAEGELMAARADRAKAEWDLRDLVAELEAAYLDTP